jgi:hypothetical protein
MKFKKQKLENKYLTANDAKPVLADSKKFVRCLGCEWIACENHKVCLRDKIK